MPLPDGSLGRQNWFYSIGVFGVDLWEEIQKIQKKNNRESGRGRGRRRKLVGFFFCVVYLNQYQFAH